MSELVFILPAEGSPEAEASEVAAGDVDHVTNALARLVEQFKLPTIQALAAVLVAPVQSIEDALQQLYSERGVDTALGDQLDALGGIVGQDRGGLSDDDYRRYIRARIATNKSRGRVEDLITVARLVVYEDDAGFQVDQQGIAAVVLRVRDVVVSDDVAEILIAFLRQTVAAGVRVILETLTSVTNAFTFGLYAFADGAIGLGATTIVVREVDALPFPASGSILIDAGLAAEETVTYTHRMHDAFLGCSPTAFVHPDGAPIQVPPAGRGWGDENLDPVGGEFAAAWE